MTEDDETDMTEEEIAAWVEGGKSLSKSRTEWEYFVYVHTGTTTTGAITKALNRFGVQGWELVAVGDKGYYFKRPI